MVEIPKTVADQALDLLNQSFTLLQPYLDALTSEDRRMLPKVADGTETFLEKSVDYMETSGQFRPAYMNVNDVKSNYNIAQSLTPFGVKLNDYCSLVSDTKMKASSGAYTGALQYYNSIKIATKNRIPGAKMIFEDLKKRFERKKIKKEEDAAGAAAATEMTKVA